MYNYTKCVCMHNHIHICHTYAHIQGKISEISEVLGNGSSFTMEFGVMDFAWGEFVLWEVELQSL